MSGWFQDSLPCHHGKAAQANAKRTNMPLKWKRLEDIHPQTLLLEVAWLHESLVPARTDKNAAVNEIAS